MKRSSNQLLPIEYDLYLQNRKKENCHRIYAPAPLYYCRPQILISESENKNLAMNLKKNVCVCIVTFNKDAKKKFRYRLIMICFNIEW